MKEEENVISLTLTDTGNWSCFVDSRTRSYEQMCPFRGPRVEMIFSVVCLYTNFKMLTP